MLYPGEELTQAAGFPALTRFEAGQHGAPLVVFITGGGILARIAYGPADGDPAEFLAFWLHQAGFSTLALSYPIANPVFGAAVFPEFTVHDWAAQSAELVARCLAAHGLARRVLVLGWSMGGRIAEPLNEALGRRNIEVELFVGLAASTALPNLLPGLRALQPAASGLARVEGMYLDWLQACLREQSAAAGRTIIDPARFAGAFTGDMPMRLTAAAMRPQDGAFIADPCTDAVEIGAADYAGFPPLALMSHTAPIDARHALTDFGAWGFYITQTLAEQAVFARSRDFTKLPPESWQRLRDTLLGAAGRLCLTLPGNHMFFVGEQGARDTVATLQRLRAANADIRGQLAALLR